MENKLLQKAMQAVEGPIPPKKKAAYERIVLAGLKMMFSPQTHEHFFKGANGGNVAGRCALVIAAVMTTMSKESKGTMPLDVAMPASIVLFLNAMDFMASLGAVKIDKQSIDVGMRLLGQVMKKQAEVGAAGGQSPAQSGQQPPDQPPAQQPAQQPAAPAGGLIMQGA